MTDATIAAPGEPLAGGHATSTGLSNEKLAMWVFLASECLLFGGLISTYLLLHDRSVEGPTPQDVYDIPFTSVCSFVLLMSSLTMVLAVSAIDPGRHAPEPAVAASTTALLGHDLHRRPGLRVHVVRAGRAWATPRTSSARPSTR